MQTTFRKLRFSDSEIANGNQLFLVVNVLDVEKSWLRIWLMTSRLTSKIPVKSGSRKRERAKTISPRNPVNPDYQTVRPKARIEQGFWRI
jgi:hypothetical protein